MATITESTGKLPLTEGQSNGFAAHEVLPGGQLGGIVSGSFRRVPDNLMETYTPKCKDDGFIKEAFDACMRGDFREALLLARTFEARPYNRTLAEGTVATDLDTILDGSTRTHVFDAWKELTWPWTECVRLASYGDYETHKIATNSEIIVDDKTANTVVSGTLPEVPENMGYDEATIAEKYESIQIKDYGCVFSITERALRADDKRVFPGLPKLLGRCARRTVSANVAYCLEQSSTGPTMTEDSVALFNAASHSNLAAVDLSAAYVKAGYAALAAQKAYIGGATGRVMGLRPAFLIVPTASELAAAEIVGAAATTLVATALGSTSAAARETSWNILAGRLKLSVWPDLTDTDSWYLFTDPAEFPTLEVAFLDGRQEPILEVQGGIGPDLSNPIGRKYRVRMPHGVTPVDWRGMYCSTGA